jgi:carboxypeptidase Q
VAASAGADLSTFTQAEIGPRLTGSRNDARAIAWALQKFRRAGLRNVHEGRWSLPTAWQRGVAHAELVAPNRQSLRVTSYAWTGSTPSRMIAAGTTVRVHLEVANEVSPGSAVSANVIGEIPR